MSGTIELRVNVSKEQERSYLPVCFDVPEGVERLDFHYSYPRQEGAERCTIDFALVAPGEDFIGASGSNRDRLTVSPLGSSRGFVAKSIAPGRWEIILGAYEVPKAGVEVVYRIDMAHKRRRLFKGDTHVHTLASDGSGTAEDIARLAQQSGLDYVFLTDHNNHVQNDHGLHPEGLTILPGCEWTHYKGHAVMLGGMRPITGRYGAGNRAEAEAIIEKARELGAFVSLAHPFCSLVPWEWGMDMPCDGIEVWNGIMSERNLLAIDWWQGQLAKGRRIPVTGGSDYHRPALLEGLAMPCLCVYAPSREPWDILGAIRAGAGYLSYIPQGPGVDILRADDGTGALGSAVPADTKLTLRFSALLPGDEICLITAEGTERVDPAGEQALTLSRRYANTPFVRAEVMRSFDRYTPATMVLAGIRGLPPMKAMVSNPVYFEG